MVSEISLSLSLSVSRETGMSKQCRPRSDQSSLFATHSANLHTVTGSIMDLLKRSIR